MPLNLIQDSTNSCIAVSVSALLLNIVHIIHLSHFNFSFSRLQLTARPLSWGGFFLLDQLDLPPNSEENVLHLVRPHNLVRDGQHESLAVDLPPSKTVRCGGPFVEMTCPFLCRPIQSTFAHWNGRHPLLSSLKRGCCSNYFYVSFGARVTSLVPKCLMKKNHILRSAIPHICHFFYTVKIFGE